MEYLKKRLPIKHDEYTHIEISVSYDIGHYSGIRGVKIIVMPIIIEDVWVRKAAFTGYKKTLMQASRNSKKLQETDWLNVFKKDVDNLIYRLFTDLELDYEAYTEDIANIYA